MSFEVQGRIHAIMETQHRSDTFWFREFVLETQNGDYKNFVKFQLVKDKTTLIDAYSIGQFISLKFDLSGRSFVDKNGRDSYITNLVVYYMEASTMPDGFGESSGRSGGSGRPPQGGGQYRSPGGGPSSGGGGNFGGGNTGSNPRFKSDKDNKKQFDDRAKAKPSNKPYERNSPGKQRFDSFEDED